MPNRSDLWNKLVSIYRTSVITPDLRLITMAQWALESSWGKSDLAKKHFNFAGLKYRTRMKDHAASVDYEAHDGIDTYCKFTSIDHFIEGYWHFIGSGPYPDWNNYQNDPIGYISYLKTNGYASDNDYVAKVVRIYNTLIDELGAVDEPERPARSVFGDIAPPVFEIVSGARHRKKGKYPNKLEGLIVHYDAFRIRRKNSPEENSDSRSRQTIQMGHDNGYRYACISRTGRIFVPENWDWKNWGSHAGISKCPETGRTSVSQYYVGIEINNPGLLYESQDDGVYCPWYNSKRTDTGRVILDDRGRCFMKEKKDEWYSHNEVRHGRQENIHPGYYLPYTEDQFQSLVSIIAYLNTSFPSFSIDRVFGHDEVSPGRKQDPGGALAYDGKLMTMPEFRAHLKKVL